MHRRAFALPSLLFAAAIAIGACGPSTPTIDDPAEILAKAVEALEDVKTVHLELSVEGTINMDLIGAGGGAGIGLTGTKLTADVDFEQSNLAATLAVPAMLGMTAEVIVIDGDTYTRTSFTGEKYAKSPLTDIGLPIDPSNPAASFEQLKAFLERPEVNPLKRDDASCGSKTCYQIEVDLSTADLRALIPDAADIGDAQVILTVLVEKDSLKPAGFEARAGATDIGEVMLTLSLSKWDESLSISAPPADQVE